METIGQLLEDIDEAVMKLTWNTQNGHKLHIWEMDTDHVFNSMKMIYNHLADGCGITVVKPFHNMYFDDVINCGPYSLEKDTQMSQLLKDFYEGGPRKFKDEIKRLAKVSRNGWVVLNFCTMTKQLYLDVIDLHDQHVVACALPVMALDMWEHAYYSDFGLDKEAYVEWYLSRLDWRNVRKRIKNYQRIR